MRPALESDSTGVLLSVIISSGDDGIGSVVVVLCDELVEVDVATGNISEVSIGINSVLVSLKSPEPPISISEAVTVNKRVDVVVDSSRVLSELDIIASLAVGVGSTSTGDSLLLDEICGDSKVLVDIDSDDLGDEVIVQVVVVILGETEVKRKNSPKRRAMLSTVFS